MYASYDSFGNIINELYSTPFASGGFDLNGVGVINQKTLGDKDFNIDSVTLYPNPVSETVYLNSNEESSIIIFDITGRLVKSFAKGNYTEINISDINPGTYLFEVTIQEKKITKKMVII